MEFMKNIKLTASQTDNVSKNGCSTVYSFGIYYFYMQVIWISNNFGKNLYHRHHLCTSNWTIPIWKHHGWDRLSWPRSSPGYAGEVLHGGPDSYFLLYLLPLDVLQDIFHIVSDPHTIVISVDVMLLPSPPLSPTNPLFIPCPIFRRNDSMLWIIP